MILVGGARGEPSKLCCLLKTSRLNLRSLWLTIEAKKFYGGYWKISGEISVP